MKSISAILIQSYHWWDDQWYCYFANTTGWHHTNRAEARWVSTNNTFVCTVSWESNGRFSARSTQNTSTVQRCIYDAQAKKCSSEFEDSGWEEATRKCSISTEMSTLFNVLCWLNQHFCTRLKEHQSRKKEPVYRHFEGCGMKLSLEDTEFLAATTRSVVHLMTLEALWIE